MYKQFFIATIGAFLAIFIFLFIFQRKLIYFPDNQDFDRCSAFEDVEKINWQGTRMYVNKISDKWLVFYHGNAGSACDRSFFIELLQDTNYSYLFVEYTGYSGDPGTPSQIALMKNVEGVVGYLNSRNAKRVIVLGESLGTSLAAYHNFLETPDKTLLISSFSSLENVVQAKFQFFPVGLFLFDKYPTEKWIRNSNNLLFIHGAKDEVVPIEFGQRLFESVQGKNKTFIIIKDAGHNDIYNHSLTKDSIKNFLR
ncbi:hypothetical protein A2803_04360 [Candidatus Woesebacteria bacterium RIFCSPHIGHO2_01_FULL_44_21]|uniref:Serine aminopeptidase S33 domain-containing protein n=1 Tax=Candidatus Woesebacteria bacterium RIFCSPHIGHO2_01_FULL_44_21 TaxID=1802503 RepID=A0A1F7Z1C8_9BACT|nr:MAG: hypothetical protein A2803_04360 [Candidatus Woesebacteria bacterium RIFCSPHIGHO2_01_FULL_44_21]OGM71500.1 MAG: hypothetical protein A2897_04245 [Candidatus Woesebacteria bacterium RIFCSPLOWO2_01_FULL_44_24b]